MTLKEIALTIVSIAMVGVVGVCIIGIMPKHGIVVYDCGIAEIHPDYPVSVKEECRKARMEQVK
jgi:hypothetical protein